MKYEIGNKVLVIIRPRGTRIKGSTLIGRGVIKAKLVAGTIVVKVYGLKGLHRTKANNLKLCPVIKKII